MASCDPPGFGRAFRLTLLTDDPALARAADEAGIDRIGLDIERLGKAERQKSHPGARISPHTLEQLARLKPAVRRARLFCRLDPPNAGSRAQVERALELGATSLMLPYFAEPAQARAFAEAVDGRAEVLLLVETRAAFERIGELAALPGVDEIMVGLNDLSWDLGLKSRFELLVSPELQAAGQALASKGRAFGVGGLAQWNVPGLPVPPDLVIAQYPRLGARAAWLARSFLTSVGPDGLTPAVERLRARLDHWAMQDRSTLDSARQALEDAIGRAAPQP